MRADNFAVLADTMLTPMSNPACKETVSAGAIVLRRVDAQAELLVVERTTGVDAKWAPVLRQLPKGTCEPAETLETTALREVREETGYAGIILEKAGIASWHYHRAGCFWRETVHYFLMTLESSVPQDHDHEFDRVRWVRVSEAAQIVSYPEEKQLLANISEKLAAWRE